MVKKKKISGRMSALLALLVVGVVVGVLIAYEQIPLLYVIATLSIVTLPLVVGFSDLENVSRTDDENAGSEA